MEYSRPYLFSHRALGLFQQWPDQTVGIHTWTVRATAYFPDMKCWIIFQSECVCCVMTLHYSTQRHVCALNNSMDLNCLPFYFPCLSNSTTYSSYFGSLCIFLFISIYKCLPQLNPKNNLALLTISPICPFSPIEPLSPFFPRVPHGPSWPDKPCGPTSPYHPHRHNNKNDNKCHHDR